MKLLEKLDKIIDYIGIGCAIIYGAFNLIAFSLVLIAVLGA